MAEEARQSHPKRSRGVIDRVEDGGTAVVLVGEDEATKVLLPSALLPAGAADGDHLVITVALDPDSRAQTEARVKELQDKLERRTGAAGRKDFKL